MNPELPKSADAAYVRITDPPCRAKGDGKICNRGRFKLDVNRLSKKKRGLLKYIIDESFGLNFSRPEKLV